MTAPKAQHDEIWKKWNDWFDRSIGELYALHTDRRLFKDTRDAIVTKSPGASSYWLEHYARLYSHKQAIAIRRVMDKDDNAEAFGRLLRAMEQSPQVFTLDRFLAGASDDADTWLLEDMHKQFAAIQAPGRDHIDPTWVKEMYEQLRTELSAVLDFADRVVAHLDQRGPKETVTYGQIYDAVDVLGAQVQLFGARFRATHYALEPVPQGDWQAPFRKPLFEPLEIHPPWGWPDY